MKREIKFRAWDGEKMIYSENGQFYLMPTNIQIPSSTGHEFYDKDYPIMQFTGLRDKNQKEIYEGDILHFVTYEGGGFGAVGIEVYHEVVFGNNNTDDSSLSRYIGFWAKDKNGRQNSIEYLFTHGSVVVGSIHENPELFK